MLRWRPTVSCSQQVLRESNASRPHALSAISVLGASLDVGNRGVLALGVSLADLFARLRPPSPINFHYWNSIGGKRRLAGEPPVDVHVHNCRRSLTSAPAEHIGVILFLAFLYRLGIRSPARQNGWLRSLLDAEFIGDIRGGDSFSDIYGFRRFVEGCLPLLSAALLGCRYTLLPQTYGPFRLPLSRWLATLLLRQAATVLTRDRNCEEIVRRLSGRMASFCPDVAFTLQAMRPEHISFTPGNFDLGGRHLLVGVNVSGLLFMGGYTRRNMFALRSDYREMIGGLVDRLLASTTARVLLVPHAFDSEREEEACSSILVSAGSRYPGRVFMLTTALTEREIKWLIGRTDFFVGSRMHACIAALSQGVPAIGLSYSNKFLGVFESAGVGESVIDLRQTEGSQVIEQTMAALTRRTDIARQLQIRVAAIKEEIVSVFDDLLPDPIPESTVGDHVAVNAQ